MSLAACVGMCGASSFKHQAQQPWLSSKQLRLLQGPSRLDTLSGATGGAGESLHGLSLEISASLACTSHSALGDSALIVHSLGL